MIALGRLRPFTGSHVVAAHASSTVPPPHDTLPLLSAPDRQPGAPPSFLDVLPTAEQLDGDLDAALAENRAALDRLLDAGRFAPLPDPAIAVVTLTAGDQRSVYVVGDLEAAAFQDGRVLPHERVRPERVVHLDRYLDVVGYVSTPVCVTHRPDARVDTAVAPVLERPPVVVFRDVDGLLVTLRVVDGPEEQRRIIEAIDAAGTLYIADGHHRAAAVARHAERHGLPDTHPGARVLVAAVPADQLVVLPFHRRITTDAASVGGDVARWLAGQDLPITPLDGPTVPDRPGTFTLVQHGRWWLVDARARRRPGPVEGLDARLVEREVVSPLLGTEDAARDPRVETVPHPAGLAALDRDGTVGIALHPPGTEALMEVADAGAVMPPKTTYVTPKLRSGLVIAPRR